jgi:uncharacterized protein YdiU (UPF0061 family)
LRSSVREFLAQEHIRALGIPTSRSLSLYVSKTETVNRPWYSEGSHLKDPDVLISEAVAISTRVAPSFIRVGQLELFGRRARKKEQPQAMAELEMIVLHLIDREYGDVIDKNLTTAEKVVLLAREFRSRLTSLIANWIRVGFCQGNFNSDNCAAGGYTLDFGPFGFCDEYNPQFQPWTGGGHHYSFMNQPIAAERNFHMFWTALLPLMSPYPGAVKQLEEIRRGFASVMNTKMEAMWAAKLGLEAFDAGLFSELEALMVHTQIDYTIFFRELSMLPDTMEPLQKSFYLGARYKADSEALDKRWLGWLEKWKTLNRMGDTKAASFLTREALSKQMKLVNPKYTLREWFLAPAYQQAALGNYSLVRELQDVITQPYDEQSMDIEQKFYKLKPFEFFEAGGVSHYSCSS